MVLHNHPQNTSTIDLKLKWNIFNLIPVIQFDNSVSTNDILTKSFNKPDEGRTFEI